SHAEQLRQAAQVGQLVVRLVSAGPGPVVAVDPDPSHSFVPMGGHDVVLPTLGDVDYALRWTLQHLERVLERFGTGLVRVCLFGGYHMVEVHTDVPHAVRDEVVVAVGDDGDRVMRLEPAQSFGHIGKWLETRYRRDQCVAVFI